MRDIVINGHRIADDELPYVIAEVGHNHAGKFDTARTMIMTAAECGATAVKLQKRDNDSLYSRALLDQPYDNEHSFGRTYGEHRKALEFGSGEYLACRMVAQNAKIDFFATAFDEVSADFLMKIGVPAIKIASGGLRDAHLLRHVAKLGVPIIVSTGGGTWEDVDFAVDLLTAYTSNFALLHCTAAYPILTPTELNLLAIVEMRSRYPNTAIGFSCHYPALWCAHQAYAYGARLFEYHFTLNRASKGTDHAFSLEPQGLRTLCSDLKSAHEAKGDGVKKLLESERKPLAKMRREDTPLGLKITGRAYVHH